MFQYATVQIPYNSTNKITGAGAIISLHNPQNLSGHQFSAGRIKVQIGIESIQVGWIVSFLSTTRVIICVIASTDSKSCIRLNMLIEVT